MRISLIVGAIALSFQPCLEQAQATTVSGSIPFNTIITSDQTSATFTHQFIANDGQGNTATINLTMLSVNGELFNKLDSNTRLSIGTTFDDENHVNIGETTRFTASLVSQTGPLSKVGFNIGSLGLRDTGDPSVSWTSSVSLTAIPLNNFSGESNRTMDNSSLFHLLSTSNYVGELAVTANQFQFSETGGATGLNFNVSFTAVIPEPATASLGLLALGGMMMRRRRMA